MRAVPWIALALLLLALPGVAFAGAPDADPWASFEKAKMAFEEDSATRLQTLEPAALERADGLGVRQSDRLQLALANGKKVEFSDTPQCDPDMESRCIRYRLLAYVKPIHEFIVGEFHYESIAYLAIDARDGTANTFDAFPVFSPSGTSAIVVINDKANADAIALQVWQRRGGRYVKSWEGSPYVDKGYTLFRIGRWLSDSKVEGTATRDGTSDTTPKDVSFAVSRRSGRWHVESGPH